VIGGTRLQLQTLNMFRYRSDCALCTAARANTRRSRQRRQVPDSVGGPPARRRRQTDLPANNEISQQLINTIFADEDKSVMQKL